MDRRIVKGILYYGGAVVLSLLFAYVTYYILSFIWPLVYPESAKYLPYTSPFETPVHWVVPPAVALFILYMFPYIEGSLRPESITTLIFLLFLVFFSYYVGVIGFYFYAYGNITLVNMIFQYFLYVPYWGAVGGVLGAWVAARFLKRWQHPIHS